MTKKARRDSRRTDRVMEKVVSTAARLMDRKFSEEASLLCTFHDVPFTVAHRVLTNPKLRRT